MKNLLGYLATKKGHVAVVLCLKVLYFSHQIVPDSGLKKKEMLTAKDLTRCHCQAQMLLLPCEFFLFRVFGSNSRGH